MRTVLGLSAASLLLLSACQSTPDKPLPIYGGEEIAPGDTVYPRIPDYTLLNQDRQTVTPATFAGKVYVSDFFFATCPDICPVMQTQMLRVYEKYKDDPRVGFISHTIDPSHDSIPVLRDYAQRLGVPTARQWHFVTAPRDTIFHLARIYMAGVQLHPDAPRGVLHSGAFALVDPQRHIRGVYDGTVPDQVDKLLADLPRLLAELPEAPAAAAK
ncbi:SCO family protein [Hymenobacter gummosus]|uniref:SCO family protein n=1 Tax=Hymenobacter gummosus TaxID=1776032 RepID=A0A3S0JG05_9BACT|nr:SCO family protein [Hymenobacter gummosus]